MKASAAQRLTLFLLLFFSLACGAANAQEETNQTRADENFTLNITEERVTETNYERSTKVEVTDAEKNLSVRVGAAVGAQKIDIILRGITGNVRFRASLEKISRLFERGTKQNEP